MHTRDDGFRATAGARTRRATLLCVRRNFFTSQPSKTLFSLFLIFAYFFSALTISEIFEDYIHNEKIKNVANKLLITFAILIPILTIWSIFNIKI